MMNHEETIGFIRAIKTGETADQLIAMLKPSAWLVPGEIEEEAGEDEGGGRSFLGGAPLLMKGTPWPRWDPRGDEKKAIEGMEELVAKNPDPALQAALERVRGQMSGEEARPLGFVGQIFLDEVASAVAIEGLPKNGSLAFFFDAEGCPGGYLPEHKGSCRVIYSPEGSPLEPMEPPADLAESGRYGRRPVTIEPLWLPPYMLWDSNDEELSDLLGTVTYQLGESTGFGGEQGGHRIGGYPYDSFNPKMELDCELASRGLESEGLAGDDVKVQQAQAALEWVMLLEVTADSVWTWGDPGKIMFWIRKRDLERGVFDDVWALFEPD